MAGPYPDGAVAVIGMACKFAGTENLEEYWDILNTGKSMCREAPEGRFATQDNVRNQEKSIYMGNFLSEIDKFDHKFFRKSSREAASMDPQQRLLLEVAYQALESSGYFGPGNKSTDVGCYVGVCASDYNDNVASHPPNAFSTLGTLRAFLSGKVSHFFGLTGPAITFDTACSSSAVAIDAACKAIQLGSCYSAVAGGVSIFTSPYFFQNLSAASFLSPTGATKSFDADADGYCRGEGVGLVVLKKLSHAVADGDYILGTLLSTAVNQSSNQVPITVPYSASQTALYQKVLNLANVKPEEVTYLEAHGTGTRIGDPQEYEGIREVFGGNNRREVLHFASVKGNIGHTEGASGVAALIKTLLMMQRQTIPRQASFKRLNPKIKLEPGRLEVPTSSIRWDADTLTACVNNYGAAGSIAAMVVQQAPKSSNASQTNISLSRYPLFISANSAKSLGDYASALRSYINHQAPSTKKLLANVAFNLSCKQNRSLPQYFAATVSNMSELDDQLRILATVPQAPPVHTVTKGKPVVLVFGGQTNRFVGLNREVHDSSILLRYHLDEVDALLISFGASSIYPGIFETEPRDDIVALQTMQFALQYACAKAWIDCGLHIDAIVGHSFGQLVALTVSGVLSLYDGLKLVHGRASLMAQKWGHERGAMVALDASPETVAKLISSARSSNGKLQVEVACYNGPKSQVLVGSEASIDGLVHILDQSATVKYKKLNVTHGFHSHFTEPILPELQKLAQDLTFNDPKIPLIPCSDDEHWSPKDPKLVAEHTRVPVYFGKAIKSVVERFSVCSWLEAGSNSSVISMVRRALDEKASAHSFFPVNLGKHDAVGSLADTTANLWKHGHHAQFWLYHPCQKDSYSKLNIPPYQFEKTRHWLDWKEPSPADTLVEKTQTTPELKSEPEIPRLISLLGFTDTQGGQVDFRIDPRSEEWKRLVEGHAVLGNPLCPAPLYVELVCRAVSDLSNSKPVLSLRSLEIESPLGLSQNTYVRLQLTPIDQDQSGWNFAFYTEERNSGEKATSELPLHATGRVYISKSNEVDAELQRTSKLLSYGHLEKLLKQRDGEAMNGSLVYRVFHRVVQYYNYYKGVSSVVSKDSEVAAEVVLNNPPLEWTEDQVCNPIALDNFLQVAGLHANSLRPCAETDVFVCTKLDRIQLSSKYKVSDKNGSWGVYSILTTISDKEVENDVYVFDSATKELVLLVFGARFSKVLISSLGKVLARANNATPTSTSQRPSVTSATKNPGLTQNAKQPSKKRAESPSNRPPTEARAFASKPNTAGLDKELRHLLGRITDVPEEDFKGEATLDELGIDSLMITEIVSEISSTFGVSIPQDDLAGLSTFRALRDYLVSHGARGVTPQINEDVQVILREEVASAVVQQKSTTTSIGIAANEEQVHRLSQLVASHLDCPASEFHPSTNLADQGLDSLLSMELASDIEKLFCVKIDVTLLTMESTFQELVNMVIGMSAPSSHTGTPTPSGSVDTTVRETSTDTEYDHLSLDGNKNQKLVGVQSSFEEIQYDYDSYAEKAGFTGFWKNVYPMQAQLVLAYVVETFADLGYSIDEMVVGQKIPVLPILPKHAKLREVFHEILRDGKLVHYTGKDYIRSEHPVDKTSSAEVYERITREYTQHAKEHQLLHLCGSILAQLVSGQKDPLQLLFGTKKNKELLEEVYSTGPMYLAMSQLLGSFLETALKPAAHSGKEVHILELGAGTGATTRWVVETLCRAGVPFTYTFTDISTSLVASAKRKFAKYDFMKYMVLDIEKSPPEEFHKHFDVVLSTNCIHATSNLPRSLTHIYQMIQPGGFVSLVEFTKNMFWFDIVFGLLEGWWLFNDGRQHVLADEAFWEQCMRGVGFQHVGMTDGSSEEAKTVRIITGFTEETKNPPAQSWVQKKQEDSALETVAFKTIDKDMVLLADIYYPSAISPELTSKKWPVGKFPLGIQTK
jgi:acyl transferase domain-containing protein/acyl carrier protein/SAM-dependent methyltransferase